MESELLTFKQFNDPALAEELIGLLAENNIKYLVEEQQADFNPLTAINNELAKSYSVKIDAGNFTKVTLLLKEREDQYINNVEADHYLFDFTDEELTEILEKEDEWSSFDYELAKKILNQRGIIVDTPKLATLNQKRIEELRAPEPSQLTWIIIGYICALLGGVLGFFIGWHLSSHKKTLPNGESVYAHNPDDRKHGKIIFYLSFIGLAIGIIFKFRIYS